MFNALHKDSAHRHPESDHMESLSILALRRGEVVSVPVEREGANRKRTTSCGNDALYFFVEFAGEGDLNGRMICGHKACHHRMKALWTKDLLGCATIPPVAQLAHCAEVGGIVPVRVRIDIHEREGLKCEADGGFVILHVMKFLQVRGCRNTSCTRCGAGWPTC